MSRKEILAYAITHAPPGVKGGPYEANHGASGTAEPSLIDALRWPATSRPTRYIMRLIRKHAPHARVIRIVRARPTQQPSEASAVEVLRELVAYPGNGGDLARIQARARCVLAASGPDPSEVVRAAMAWSEATAANGTARTVALQLACVAYRKAGGK